jgi:hypothetical protein
MMSPASGGTALIDDFEDGDNAIALPRTGWWFTFNDKTAGTQTPAPDATGNNPFLPEQDAASGSIVGRTHGSGFTKWGAALGVQLRGGTMQTCPFDASAFSGITFKIKTSTPVRFKVPTPPTTGKDSDPVNGTCVPTATEECYNDFGAPIGPTTEWKTINLAWSDLKQAEDWGVQVSGGIPSNAILALQWQVVQGVSFDFAIDDLAFIE